MLEFVLSDVCHYRALWSMRNYIHVMLCANMFVAQLLFVVGVERTENKVGRRLCMGEEHDVYVLLSSVGCLFSHCCFAPILVPGGVHVDADGGCGPVCCTCESVHYSSRTIHCWIHNCQLWLVD